MEANRSKQHLLKYAYLIRYLVLSVLSGVQVSVLSLNQMAVCVSVLTLLTLTKQSSVRYTQCLHWMRTSLNWETVRSSPNSTLTVGFWQIPLDDESRLLATFVTLFGRSCFNRLPFGSSSVPEIFQRTMSRVLEGSEGTLCQMDDVLIHGVDQSEHDGRVRAVLHRLG